MHQKEPLKMENSLLAIFDKIACTIVYSPWPTILYWPVSKL